MNNCKSKLVKIRLISFAFFLAVAGIAAICMLKAEAKQARLALEHTYLGSIAELASYVDNIDVSLEKTLCAGTSSGAVMQAAKVWRESAAAKACLTNLPYTDIRLENTGKFLSQVGEYAYSLTNRAATGQEITEEERETLKKLSDYAVSLKEQLYSLLTEIEDNGYSWNFELSDLGTESNNEDAFTQMEGSFEDYPSLIYDGPFSDHIDSGKAEFLKGKEEITEEEAGKTVEKYLGKPLIYSGKSESSIPVYVFTGENEYAEVTVKGGVIINYSDNRSVNKTEYSVGEGLSAAEEFLKEADFINMKQTYYIEDDNTLLINFAYAQNGVICYPDLVKVKIAMDDLSVIGFESAGFIANHKYRSLPESILTVQDAKAGISSYLTVEEVNTAVICPHGLTEYYVYEFKCVSDKNRQVLVYIDAQTGREADILLLLDTPGGTLTV